MKIFDATSMIAMLEELDRPDLIDGLLELGHDLAVPKYVAETEMRSAKAKSGIRAMVRMGKIKILNETSPIDLLKFHIQFPGVGPGESHVILAYNKMISMNKVAYCVFDDQKARAHAKRTGIKHTGLIGLLRMLREREILTVQEIYEIGMALKNTTFRLPKGFSI